MSAAAAIVAVALVFGVAYVAKAYWFEAYYIPSEAMSPTLEVGDRILVDKQADVGGLPRGTVIVLNAPPGTPGDVRTMVKRIIGLPGEAITFTDGRVHIDGAVLDEPWLPAGVITQPRDREVAGVPSCTDADPCVVPAAHVWVMGDNRPNSVDSRYLGPIAQDLVIGKVTEIVWPRARAGSVR